MDWSNAVCLDGFSGTGSIGFEMLSRGALEVHFIDKNPKSIQHIQKQLDTWNMKNTKTVQTDIFEFAFRHTSAYDLIFLDPPYALTDALQLPERFIQYGLLKPDGLLVLEHGPDWAEHTPKIPGWKTTKKYGHVHFSYFHTED